MKLAEKHHKQYKKNSTTIKPKIIKEEKLPDWFDKEIKKENATQEEQDELNNLLSKYH